MDLEKVVGATGLAELAGGGCDACGAKLKPPGWLLKCTLATGGGALYCDAAL